jgi:cell wall-associated NlpC family hydrolase
MVLSGPPAQATTASPALRAASTSTLDEAPTPGEVAGTATVSDTEKVKTTRKVKVVVTRKLTSKVKAKGTATRSRAATRSATSKVTVTRYAPTVAEAQAEAKQVALAEAKKRAAAAAKAKATKSARATAKLAARKVAKSRANTNVRKRFGTVVLRKAKALRGRPYRYGATGPRAFDCSGFTGYVMKRGAGVKGLPRTSQAQYNRADHISKRSRKPGDLIFFYSGSHVYHVAIYAGGGKIWHAPGSGRTVRKVKIWTSKYKVGRLPA